ncbi:hypothetical protein O3G_MSEX014938 [Manduca sexta]|uniref:Uncharacterized protein n=1 Tax=Manduca sexta TaxID=7130 RepID=A0A922D0C8_MANSE|nr:hypothetical protein O3G_MSEX014938 [Manduca sexta]
MANIAALESVLSTAAIAAATAMSATSAASNASMLAPSPLGRESRLRDVTQQRELVHTEPATHASIYNRRFRANAGRTRRREGAHCASMSPADSGAPLAVAHAPTTADHRTDGAIY